MAHNAARKSRQHGEMLTDTTLNCRKLLENSLEKNWLYWMTEMAALFSIALGLAVPKTSRSCLSRTVLAAALRVNDGTSFGSDVWHELGAVLIGTDLAIGRPSSPHRMRPLRFPT